MSEDLKVALEEPRVHHVKVNEDAWADIVSGRKTFEVRVNDRYYQAGDLMMMTEVDRDDPRKFAEPGGRRVRARIRYVHSGYGLQPEFVVLGLADVKGPSYGC